LTHRRIGGISGAAGALLGKPLATYTRG
jgi:hypothetical protein